VIVVHYSGSHLVANSKALELAGIGRDSIDPPGGSIGRWPGSKEPDGVLEGAAATALLGALPQLPADDRQAMIQQGQTLYLQNGYTTAVEARATPDDLALYTQAADTGALKLDVLLYADLASAGASLKGHKIIGPKYYKGHLQAGRRVLRARRQRRRPQRLAHPALPAAAPGQAHHLCRLSGQQRRGRGRAVLPRLCRRLAGGRAGQRRCGHRPVHQRPAGSCQQASGQGPPPPAGRRPDPA
jgi:hypothetical protein